MKRGIGFILAMILIALIAGCTYNDGTLDKNDSSTTVKLYYADANNEKMLVEERKVSPGKDENLYEAALRELIKGPSGNDKHVNIPSETKVYGTIRQNDAVIVDLAGFTGFGGSIAELMAVGTIVNTLAQFEGIERVKILVEGEELIGPSGEPRGFMSEFPTQP